MKEDLAIGVRKMINLDYACELYETIIYYY